MRSSTCATLGIATLSSWRSSPTLAASDTVRVGVVGIGGRGKAHIAGFQKQAGVEVVALCDVDDAILQERASEHQKISGKSVRCYRDMRRLFEDKDIDAVSFATPNHWHALGGIWAMEAGKHTYIEKPCSHNVWEGRQLVNAARKYNRLCQHGTQGRSSPAILEAIGKLRQGVIGDVYMARGLCFKWRPSIGKCGGPQAVPQSVDYDLWCGPAPKKPLMRNRLHYDWHWQWDYGNGDMGNQGVHEMDMARWGLGVGLPTRITGTGGHYMFDDDQETPNTLICTFDYPEQGKMLQFETRHWICNYEGGFGSAGSNNVGVIFLGSEGYMELQYFSYRTFLGKKREPGPQGSSGEDPFKSFIAAVRSGRREDLGVDIEEGHLSSALCHLGNIAYRLKRSIQFDPVTESIPGDSEANAMLLRSYRQPFVVPQVRLT
ncbi:MAG: Gfo/Idh/MocA family oxidoreductase [Acidobacteriota bacterium]